eukprot:UN27789
MVCYIIIYLFCCLQRPGVASRSTFVAALSRYSLSASTGHALRTCIFITTSLPGPAEHCRLDNPDHLELEYTGLWDIFTRFGPSCGDLVPSGHIIIVIHLLLVMIWELPLVVDSI